MAQRVAGAPLNLEAIRQRLDRAEADLSTHAVTSPHVANVRNISDSDAAKASTPLARGAWTAANKVWGTKTVAADQGRWVDQLVPRGVITPDDVTNLKNQALRVLASLGPVGAKELPASALEDLPAKVDAYWSKTFGPRSLLPEQRDAMVQFIRDACE